MKKIKLLPHEKNLLETKQLEDITHTNSSSTWLWCRSSTESILCQEGYQNNRSTDDTKIPVYRVMGDIEVAYLLKNNLLPDTQPYQAIVPGPDGRVYMEGYLKGKKKVDTTPTTVVEFMIPRTLWDTLFAIQHKNEDGVVSVGLGNKAGKGNGLFNKSLESNESTYKIVTVKRSVKEK